MQMGTTYCSPDRSKRSGMEHKLISVFEYSYKKLKFDDMSEDKNINRFSTSK